MKEDILEQIVDDYLNLRGYFTLSNVKYKPSPKDPEYDSKLDSVNSDIDVIGFKPGETGPKSVYVVSCKSMQNGFWAEWECEAISNKKIAGGRERWKAYRELANDKWARALKRKVKNLTGSSDFTYVIACTRWRDPENAKCWIDNKEFKKRLTRNIEIWTLEEMFKYIYNTSTTTPANSDIGRLIQVLKAAKIKVDFESNI
ncbi:MAG: hypothetical protein WC562_05380 [Dehalococcoidia bacterium]